MLRRTAYKVSLLSVLGALLFVFSLLVFTGTASAASAFGPSRPDTHRHPQLNATVVGQTRSSSIAVRVSGTGFYSGTVSISATTGRHTLSIWPASIRTNRDGSFYQTVYIRVPDRSHPTQIVLKATGRSGEASDMIYLFSNRYHQPYFGR